MKSRKEIEDTLRRAYNDEKAEVHGEIALHTAYCLEVLLDIRDLLSNKQQ